MPCLYVTDSDMITMIIYHCKFKRVKTAKKELFKQRYIEDITQRREDMNFIFEWRKQYFTTDEHSE